MNPKKLITYVAKQVLLSSFYIVSILWKGGALMTNHVKMPAKGGKSETVLAIYFIRESILHFHLTE